MPDGPRTTLVSGITLVCCGLFGTLVVDDGIIERAFAEAIATQGVVSGTSAYARCMAQVHRGRGQATAEVLRSLFPDHEARAQAAHLAFDRAVSDGIARMPVRPVPGAGRVLDELGQAGCRIAVITVLPRRLLAGVLASAGWRNRFDVALSANDVARGCPAPDLALTAMLQVGIGNVSDVAFVHATGAGMECGRRAGAGLIAGVLTGPHPAARLRAAGATHLIGGISELPALLSAYASAVTSGKSGRANTRDSGAAKVTTRIEPRTRTDSVSVPPQRRA